MNHLGEFLKGDFSPWTDIHGADHAVSYVETAGQVTAVCTTCSVFQLLNELEAGIAAVEVAI